MTKRKSESVPNNSIQNVQKTFEWMLKNQKVFDALREALSTVPVLRNPDFSKESILETDTSLNGLCAIPLQQGKDEKIHVVVYVSHSLCPSKRSMHHYRSVKLELLALKWEAKENSCGYLLGLQFQFCTDNRLLINVQDNLMA